MLTRVHVNRHTLARNRKTGRHDPAITVKTSRSNTYAHEVEIKGPSRVVYRPDKPLACGAVLWVETRSEVVPLVREAVAKRVRREKST
jgi:hypothetical protein